jgi:hypothetical protein
MGGFSTKTTLPAGAVFFWGQGRSRCSTNLIGVSAKNGSYFFPMHLMACARLSDFVSFSGSSIPRSAPSKIAMATLSKAT